ncbi:conserved protein, unknown function [Hepatocystis sp. ex Piliocolobus tephrosceles]|nr:conserved protein, unknown function [Hepatocystis sp. ex Piliocolobus tephrosceles]VWU48803.1 conserved protein, unknown function [Hepatocystis sp. ex Piliocolobus tephrosceles]
MSSQDGNTHLNTVYQEFNTLNQFLKELNDKIKTGNNDNYTYIYDSCLEKVDNMHNKYYTWSHNEEDLNDEYMEYLLLKFVINIKSFLRNNFLNIDESLNALKNRNKKLMEKLKTGLENAENQENYIEELEKSLQIEKDKNRNNKNLVEEINNLKTENKKLKNINKQLELVSLKQMNENNKIKNKLDKHLVNEEEKKNKIKNIKKKNKKTYLYNVNNDKNNCNDIYDATSDNCDNCDGKKKSYNILNKSMSVLLKEINSNFQNSKQDNFLWNTKRSYSYNFLDTIKSTMLSEVTTARNGCFSYSQTMNEHTNNGHTSSENISSENTSNENTSNENTSNENTSNELNSDNLFKRISNSTTSLIKYNNVIQNQQIQKYETLDRYFNDFNTSLVKENIKKKTNNDNYSDHKTVNKKNNKNSDNSNVDEFTHVRNNNNVVCSNIEITNKKINAVAKDRNEKSSKCKTSIKKIDDVHKYRIIHRSNSNFSNTKLLTDVKKTLRINRTFLMNNILKKQMQKYEKKKKGKRRTLFKYQKSKISSEIENGGCELHVINNMIIEDYRCIINSFYQCIKEDIRVIIKKDDNIDLSIFSNYFKNITKEIRNENHVIKKKKIDKITRKYLHQIDSYTLKGENTFNNKSKEIEKKDIQFSLSVSKYNSFDLRKVCRNNNRQSSNSDNDEPTFFNNYKNRNPRIIDRLKELKSNISFFKIHDFINFSNKQ